MIFTPGSGLKDPKDRLRLAVFPEPAVSLAALFGWLHIPLTLTLSRRERGFVGKPRGEGMLGEQP